MNNFEFNSGNFTRLSYLCHFILGQYREYTAIIILMIFILHLYYTSIEAYIND